MSQAMTAIEDRLAAGGVVVLDGGTGTELERRGAPMDGGAWCGVATLSHGEVLRGIHEDYIRAGADVITANTFASSRNMLAPAGLGDKVAEINTRAVEIALEARDRAAGTRPVVVAGSLSHMVPVGADTDRRDPDRVPAAEAAAANFRELAGLLAAAGAELIIMEMMSDPDLAVPAIEAAVATGLPVWVGLSCRAGAGDEVVSFTRAEIPFAEAARQILAAGGSAAGVMHSNVQVTTPALDILGRVWQGPRMAYPDSGYFKMPNWQFVDIIPPDEFAAQGRRWVERGVQIVGGCCGLGVAHIERLAAGLPARAGG